MTESQARWVERVSRYCEGRSLAVGSANGVCDSCDDPEDGFFSWSSCDSCGSRLGGDRLPAHYVHETLGVFHYDICVDCVQYHANGELPEEG